MCLLCLFCIALHGFIYVLHGFAWPCVVYVVLYSFKWASMASNGFTHVLHGFTWYEQSGGFEAANSSLVSAN